MPRGKPVGVPHVYHSPTREATRELHLSLVNWRGAATPPGMSTRSKHGASGCLTSSTMILSRLNSSALASLTTSCMRRCTYSKPLSRGIAARDTGFDGRSESIKAWYLIRRTNASIKSACGFGGRSVTLRSHAVRHHKVSRRQVDRGPHPRTDVIAEDGNLAAAVRVHADHLALTTVARCVRGVAGLDGHFRSLQPLGVAVVTTLHRELRYRIFRATHAHVDRREGAAPVSAREDGQHDELLEQSRLATGLIANHDDLRWHPAREEHLKVGAQRVEVLKDCAELRCEVMLPQDEWRSCVRKRVLGCGARAINRIPKGGSATNCARLTPFVFARSRSAAASSTVIVTSIFLGSTGSKRLPFWWSGSPWHPTVRKSRARGLPRRP